MSCRTIKFHFAISGRQLIKNCTNLARVHRQGPVLLINKLDIQHHSTSTAEMSNIVVVGIVITEAVAAVVL